MSELLAFLDRLPIRETAFAVLIILVALMAALSVAFALNVLILRVRNERTARRWKRLEGLWEEPLLEALTDPDTLPALQDLVEDRYRRQFVDFVLRRARRVRGRDREILEGAAQPYLGLFEPEVESGQIELRTRAVQVLGTLGLPRYEDAVLKALDDPSPLVAMVAARSLARTGTPGYAAPILERLSRFRDWNRNFLASMLASLGAGAVPSLQEAAKDPRRAPWVRAVVVDALRHLSEAESADVAAGIVASENDRELLAAALRLLAEVGRPEHVEVIRTRTSSTDFVVRAHALSALGILGGTAEVPVLAPAVEDPSPWVAIHAARGLHAAGADETLESMARSEHPRATLARQVLLEESSNPLEESAP